MNLLRWIYDRWPTDADLALVLPNLIEALKELPEMLITMSEILFADKNDPRYLP